MADPENISKRGGGVGCGGWGREEVGIVYCGFQVKEILGLAWWDLCPEHKNMKKRERGSWDTPTIPITSWPYTTVNFLNSFFFVKMKSLFPFTLYFIFIAMFRPWRGYSDQQNRIDHWIYILYIQKDDQIRVSLLFWKKFITFLFLNLIFMSIKATDN